MASDGPADVEDRRAAETEMGEQHRLAALLERLRRRQLNRGDHVGEAQSLAARRPSRPRPEAAPGPAGSRRSCGRTRRAIA